MDDRDRTIADMNAEQERLRRRIVELESRAACDGRPEEELEIRNQAIQSSINGIALSDLNGMLTFVNPSFLDMWGFADADEVLGRHASSFWESEEQPARIIAALGEQGGWVGEMTAKRKNGELFPVQLSSTMIKGRTGSPVGMMGSFIDITERKQAETKIRNVMRLYSFLGQINQAIVRTRDRDELFRTICRVAIEFGQFRMAWVGLIEEATGIVRPAAHAGREEGYLNSLSIGINDESTSRGPTGSALREGVLTICDDVATDPRMQPWREAALKRGYRSSAAIPFRLKEKVVGSLNLYAAEPGFFTEDERKLLTAIGVDISFSLDTMEGENERKRAEEALRESKERYRSFFENAAVAVTLVDQAGHVVEANEADCRFLGYTQSELRGMHFKQFTHPEDIGIDVELFQSLLNVQRQGYEIEKRYVRKDGEVVWGRLAVSLIRDNQGLPEYTLVVCVDITERKRAQGALRESEERFRTLLAHVDSVAVQGFGPDGVVRYWNRASEVLYGYTAEEALGRNILDLIVPAEARTAIATAVARMAITGSPLPSSEVSLLRKDGSRVAVYASYAMVNMPGRAPELYCIDIDVTDRKRAEQERLEMERRLLHAQKLESLGILAGGIAHDFNNLLMAVLGNLDLALRKLSPVSPARLNIEHSAQAASRAADLTRQMLAYSGKGSFIIKPMDLSELVAENAHLFRSSVARTTELNVRLDRPLPAIEADAGQVQQVIMNLITNASEAIGEKTGVITLATGVQDCDSQCLKRSRIEDVPDAGRFVFLEVSDNGCGMDEETQQRLFDPFFTTKPKGRGLGMSAILGIVRGHRGALFVESTEGRGTTIRVLFPASHRPLAVNDGPADKAAREAADPVADPVAGGMVLVVDDEEIVRNVCKEMVEAFGLQVLTAVDGRDAVEVFTKHADDIGLVILDLSMPNMDGMAAFKELTRIKPGVKVVLCSGFDEQDSLQHFSGQGLAGFIQKPYSLKNLREALVKAGFANG